MKLSENGMLTFLYNSVSFVLLIFSFFAKAEKVSMLFI